MNRRIIAIAAIVFLIVAVCAGISVFAGLESARTSHRENAYPDTWYQREDAEPQKTISVQSFSVAKTDSENTEKLPAEKNSEKNDTSEEQKILNYISTDGSEKENPLDIYEDEDHNQYRYNQDGEIDTYRQGNNDDIVIEGDITEQQAIALTWKRISQLYEDRVAEFQLLRCDKRSGDRGYFVDFGKTYGVNGFIVGARSANAIFMSGEFSYCTISDDLLEDFDATLVENLTQEQVRLAIIPQFETKHPDVASDSIEVCEVRLIRQEDDFVLRVGISYEIEMESGENTSPLKIKDVCYYELG